MSHLIPLLAYSTCSTSTGLQAHIASEYLTPYYHLLLTPFSRQCSICVDYHLFFFFTLLNTLSNQTPQDKAAFSAAQESTEIIIQGCVCYQGANGAFSILNFRCNSFERFRGGDQVFHELLPLRVVNQGVEQSFSFLEGFHTFVK